LVQKSLVSFSLLLAFGLVFLQSTFALGTQGLYQPKSADSQLESSKSALSEFYVPALFLDFSVNGSLQNIDSEFDSEVKSKLNQCLNYSAQLVQVHLLKERLVFEDALILKQRTDRLFPSHYFW